MKLLIIGNGSMEKNESAEIFINNHTGSFLCAIAKHHEVTYSENISEFDINNNLQNFNLSNTDVRINFLPRRKSIFFLPKIFQEIKNNDFVYLFYPGTLSKIFALIAILSGKKIGFYIRGQYYNGDAIDRYILKRSKFILTVSPYFLRTLSEFCENVTVIKPMIAIDEKDLNRDRKYIEPEMWNLLFVGRVEERKGIYDLLEICKIMKREGLNFKLKIVGGGDIFEKIENKIEELKLDTEIVMTGLITDKIELKTLYDNADVFLFTSHDEGFPRVLYEAMASSLPIFTTFVGGIEGRMIDMENAIEIPVKDAEKAADIILRNIYKKDRLKQIGENGLNTVESIISEDYLSHENLLTQKLKLV